MLIPIHTKESLKDIGTACMNDFDEKTKRGMLNVFCSIHECFFDSRQGACAKCFLENIETYSPQDKRRITSAIGMMGRVGCLIEHGLIDKDGNILTRGG